MMALNALTQVISVVFIVGAINRSKNELMCIYVEKMEEILKTGFLKSRGQKNQVAVNGYLWAQMG